VTAVEFRSEPFARSGEERSRPVDADAQARLIEELVSYNAPASLEADQYRTLRHVLERLRRDSGLQLFAVTSPCPGDGKSITTLNLAGSLAQSAATRVLLIDADLHRSSVAKYLGLARSKTPGLAETLQDGCSLAQAVRRLDSLNLSVLLTGSSRSAPYELLASARLEAVLAEARRQFDFVLIDTPPVVPLADCRLLDPWIDGYLVVVGAHRTPRKVLAEALTLLDPAKVLGIVFNGDDRPLRSRYGYYNYGHVPARSGAADSWWQRVLDALVRR
jgi:capsular exopolysaccharide synthesis family protein